MIDQGPLKGLRVLDLSQGIAGPYCTKLLADYGAEVLKVEPPLGDVTRFVGPFPDDVSHPEKSGLFLHLNTNKLGITVDFDRPNGQAYLRRLISKMDVLVEDRGPGGLDSIGLDQETLSQINPSLVITSISNFGPHGPYSEYKATDLTLFAMSGWMHPMGYSDRSPLYPGGPYVLYVAGQYANVGTLLAVHHAELTGIGQNVQISVQETGISVQVYDTIMYSYFGRIRQRDGNRWARATNSIQPCKDGYINFVVGHGEERWEDLWTVLLDRPEVLDDPRFSEDERLNHQDELEEVVREALAEKDVDDLFHTGQALRLMFAPVLTAEDVMHLEHHQARGYFSNADHPVAGSLPYTGPPVRLPESPWNLGRPAPLLGQHNEVIAEEFGELTEK